MLMIKCFAIVDALVRSNSGLDLPEELLSERMPIISVQILMQTLSSQRSEGHWISESCCAATVHSLANLDIIAGFPYVKALDAEIADALLKGREALARNCLKLDEHCLDQIAQHILPWTPGTQSRSSVRDSHAKIESMVELAPEMVDWTKKANMFADSFAEFSHLQGLSPALRKASVLEALLYRPKLQAMRKDAFPSTDAKEKDKYLDYIPIMWVLSCTCQDVFVSPEYLLDMMVLSMYVFLTDEYMESTVAEFSAVEFAALTEHLTAMDPDERGVVHNQSCSFSTSPYSDGPSVEGSDSSRADKVEAAFTVFQNLANYVYSYPHISSASRTDRLYLHTETKAYLLSHMTQLEDNRGLAQQEGSAHPDLNLWMQFLRIPYHTWVNTIGAGHISGPWAFAFFTCVIGGSVRHGADAFPTVKQKLMAYSMNAHIGTFCRMYNDYGSIARDYKEGNLNSVNFPEFLVDGHGGEVNRLDNAKKILLDAAVHERVQARTEMEELCQTLQLEGDAGRQVSGCLRVYMSGCEQFSDMYLTKDVTNSVK
ncbi:MAG: hypothetical protein Q9195_002551 [Heterodermia aff. obscurata]